MSSTESFIDKIEDSRHGLVRNTTTDTACAIDSLYASQLKSRVENDASRELMSLKNYMTEDQWVSVESMYPEYRFSRVCKAKAPHGLAANLRKLEIKNLMNFVGEDAKIVDIGGNPLQHLNANRLVHCCRPRLDIRDCARATEIDRHIKTAISAKSLALMQKDTLRYNVMKEYAKHVATTKYNCTRKGEDCDAQGDVCIFVHSCYDIPYDNVAKIMKSHGADTAFACMLIPENSLVDAEGPIDSHGGRFEREGDKIRFFFEGDTSYGYEHSFSNLVKYIQTRPIKYKDYIVLPELVDKRGSCCFIRFTRITRGSDFSASDLISRIWLNGFSDKKVITYRKITDETCKYSLCNSKEFSVMVPSQLYENSVSWIQTLTTLNFQQFKQFVRSANRRFVVNGTTVTVPESMSVDVWEHFCIAMYAKEVHRRFVEKQNLEGILNAVSNLREKNIFEIIRTVFHDLWPVVSVFASLIAGFVIPWLSFAGVIVTLAAVCISAAARAIRRKYVDRWKVFLPRVEDATTYVDNRTTHLITPEDVLDESTGLSDKPYDEKDEEKVRADISKATETTLDEGEQDADDHEDKSDESCVTHDGGDTVAGNPHFDQENQCIREFIRSVELDMRNVKAEYIKVFNKSKHSDGVTRDEQTSRQSYKYCYAKDVKESYSRCVHDGKIVNLADVPDLDKVLVGGSLTYPDPQIVVDSCKEALSIDIPSKVRVIEGCAGGGKTTTIVNAAHPNGFICSPLRDSISELKRHPTIRKKGINGTAIRTIMSMLYNKRPNRYDDVCFDEYKSAHMGSIYAVARLIGARNISLYGDRYQISAVNPSQASNPWRHNEVVHCDYEELRSTTYRCPADAAAMMTRHYKRDIITNRPIVSGYDIRKVTGVEGIPIKRGVTYVFMHNDEVAEFKKATGMNAVSVEDIGTTHFFQGHTSDEVYAVRLRKQDKDLYRNMNYVNVMLTRHRVKCTYFTVVDDNVCKVINNAKADIQKNGFERYMTADAVKAYANDTDTTDETFSSTVMCNTIKTESKHYVEVKKNNVVNVTDDETPRRIIEDNGNVLEDDADEDVFGADIVVEEEFLESAVVSTAQDSDPVSTLQHVYDSWFPSTVDMKYDLSNVVYNDVDVAIDGQFAISGKGDGGVKDKCWLEPKLRTLAPIDATQTQMDTILSYASRNAGVPNTLECQDKGELHGAIWEKFCNNMLRYSEVQVQSMKHKCAKLTASKRAVHKWWNTQSTAKQQQIRGIVDKEGHILAEYPSDRLQMMVKDQRKPKMSSSAAFKYPAGQTLTFSDKVFNAFYGSIVDTLQARLRRLLKHNVVMVTDKSDDEVNVLLNKMLRRNTNRFFELDISKFDKSQTSDTLDMELLVYKKLGLDEVVSEMFAPIYGRTKVEAFKAGFTCYLYGQRKSGAPTTLFGNTLVTMLYLNYAFDIKTFDMAMFKGDDSIYAGPIIADDSMACQILEQIGNFDVKPMYTNVGYFCSSYIVKDSAHNWALVPDVVKRIEALGRRVPGSKLSTIRDKYISTVDMLRKYNCPILRENLSHAIAHRMRKELSSVDLVGVAVDALNSLTRDFETFRKAWEKDTHETHY